MLIVQHLTGSPGHFKPALESAYQADLATQKIVAFDRTALLCAVLYTCFGVLDLMAVPSNVAAAWAIRAVVLCVTAATSLATRLSRETFVRHYAMLTCLTYLVWGLGIEAIIMLTRPDDPGWSTYYAGLLLISMALYGATYLRVLHASLTGLALTLSYLALALGYQHMAAGGDWVNVVQNCFFLIGANFIGLFSLHMREHFSRQAFLLKNALKRDLELEEEAKRQSEHLSEHDALTGLPNRVRFLRRLGELLAQRHDDATVAVLFLDLDDFKPVNDRHGHAAGDYVLCRVAERVRGAIRATDLAGRLGGDEFVVALPLAAGQAELTIERLSVALRAAIGEPIAFGGEMLRVTASVGAARCPDHGQSAEELLHAADQCMYRSKRRKEQVLAA